MQNASSRTPSSLSLPATLTGRSYIVPISFLYRSYIKI